MRERLMDFVEALDFCELQKLKDTVDRGELSKIVNDKLAKKQIEHGRVCVSCASEIPSDRKAFSLVFGPPDMRMKASFCAIDCLEYFISKLKKK
ncbi:MAG: hypothetical protein V1837_02000 [Candidatus Woesearchaeota archaeon]